MQTPQALKTRAQILASFGYIILDKGEFHVALIEQDPQAFLIICDSYEEAEDEAYEFLFNEVDPDTSTLPAPESFR